MWSITDLFVLCIVACLILILSFGVHRAWSVCIADELVEGMSSSHWTCGRYGGNIGPIWWSKHPSKRSQRGPRCGLCRDVPPSWSKWSGLFELPSLVQGSGTRLNALPAMGNDSRRCGCPPFREKFRVTDTIESSLSILK